MIAVDTSALVAIVMGEDDAEQLLRAMSDEVACVSAVSLVEAQIVVESRQGPDATRDLELLVDAAVDEIVAVDTPHAIAAFTAWRRFGKGRHPAGLNLGDCFAYAVAALEGIPLLFKGADFAQTDIGSYR